MPRVRECVDDDCPCGPPCVRFGERRFLTRSAGADSFDEQVIAERAPLGEGWGVRPAPVVVDGGGHVHTVFVENGTVTHGERDPDTGTWSFEPLPDSAASDLGRQALAVGRDGALHAVWIDDHERVRHASRVCAR